MRQPKRTVRRQMPRSGFDKASLIGALEAVEEQARWLVHYFPDMWQLDSLRAVLRSIDQIEDAGRWSDDSEKRKTAMGLHPSGKNRDLTDLLESPNTHPPAATQPPEATEEQGAAR